MIKWSNMVKLCYKTYHGTAICVHLSRIFQMPFFSGVHCCFPVGSCWRKNKHLENKANKVEGDCIKAWSGGPKGWVTGHIYRYIWCSVGHHPPHHQWVWVYSILWFFWPLFPVACGGPPPVDCAGGMYLSFYVCM